MAFNANRFKFLFLKRFQIFHILVIVLKGTNSNAPTRFFFNSLFRLQRQLNISWAEEAAFQWNKTLSDVSQVSQITITAFYRISFAEDLICVPFCLTP